MPKVMSMALIVSVVLFISFFLFIEDQLNNRHRAQLEQIEKIAVNNIDNITTQVSNLAKNDLIINSLIDYEQRENYLSVFFQSLKITNSNDIAIGFLNFNAEPIVVKNWTLFELNHKNFNWRSEVLEQGQINVDVSKHGILIAAPVMYGATAEGAIVVYIKSLQDVISYSSSLGVQVLVNDEYEVMFSSQPDQLPLGTVISEKKLSGTFSVKAEGRWWRAFSVERLTKAYQDVLQLFVMVFFLLMVVIFATNYSARISAKIASQALKSLRDSISEASKGRSPINQPISRREPSEVVAIKASVNFLLHDLLNTSLSRDRFESVINSMSEPLLVLDHNFNSVLQNNSMFELGLEYRVTLPDDFNLIFPQQTWQELEQKNRVEIDYSNYGTLTSRPLVLEWRLNHYISDGQEIGFVLVATDLTKQKDLMFELQMKNKAIDEASTAIVICDMLNGDQPIVYANEAFLDLTGYPLEEVLGKNCHFLQGAKTSPTKIEAMRTAISKRETLDITVINYKKNGTPFSNNLTLSPIINDSGVLTHYIGFQHDVTEQQRTASYLKQAKERAEQSAKMKSEFLASMSHEIRTPMNGVIGTLSLMLKEELGQQQREYAVIAKDSAESLLSLINDILDFSKIEAGKLEIETQELDIESLTRSVFRTFKAAADAQGLVFTLDMTKVNEAFVLGDASRLRQVMNNIIGNALKFTQEGEVSISVETKPINQSTIECIWHIKDTGIGIKASRINSIFESFTQADSSTTREFGGTGLGLSISKQLCQLMGGDIKLNSELGVGSTFSFSARLGVSSNTDNVLFKEVEKAQPFEKVTMRALLVEDNLINQMVAKKMLTESGLDIEVAVNGAKALERLSESQQREFDVVFMDCHMPVLDGYEATQAIRNGEAGEHNKSIPIIAMTANAMKGDKEKCFEAGMDDYTPKPIDLGVLQSLLTKWHLKLHG
ncbi:hypothetical protein GCM10027050_21990 [Psychrosphaera aestuarii]